MNSKLRVPCALPLVVLVFQYSTILAKNFDITKVDLFGAKGWNSAQVSVEGLRLGMGLKESRAVLSANSLNLYDLEDRTACRATSRSCYASRNATQDGTDIEVQFGKSGRINNIYIQSPLINPMGYHRNPADITANSFKGMTRRFFFHYSDELRVNLLGPPDRVKKSPTTEAMQGQIYYYDRLGLIVGTSRSLMRGMKTPTPPELTGIQFVRPK